jgi:hypothetical protein
MNLKDAQIGSVYNFDYLQPHGGESKRQLAKVVEIRRLTEDEINRLDGGDYRKNDPEFKRSETLVTCMMPDGKTRSFYAERTENCTQPVLGGILFKVGLAWMFYR